MTHLLVENLPEDLARSAQDQAAQAAALADLTNLTPAATRALINAIWLGEWATDQPITYPGSPHAVAARRAWRNNMPMTASLLTHAGYLPHLNPLPQQDQVMVNAHPRPQGWDHQWPTAAAIYTLTTSLRSGLEAWADIPLAARSTRARWGRRSTITHAILTTLSTLETCQNIIRQQAHTARWTGIINGPT